MTETISFSAGYWKRTLHFWHYLATVVDKKKIILADAVVTVFNEAVPLPFPLAPSRFIAKKPREGQRHVYFRLGPHNIFAR